MLCIVNPYEVAPYLVVANLVCKMKVFTQILPPTIFYPFLLESGFGIESGCLTK